MTSLKCIPLLLFLTTNLVIGVPHRFNQVKKAFVQKRLLVYPLIKKLIDEVERSGLKAERLYSIPGSKTEIDFLAADCKDLKTDISKYDVNVVASYLKNVLRHYSSHLIDETTLRDLLHALKIENLEESKNKMMNVIINLRQDVRDTLAYLMEHLQKVAALQHINKMSPENIGTIFGPTLVNIQTKGQKELTVNSLKTKIIVKLLKLPSSFWKMLTNYESEESDFSNSEEDEEGAWGGADSADSADSANSANSANFADSSASNHQFQTFKGRRKSAQRASRKEDRITDSNEENNSSSN